MDIGILLVQLFSLAGVGALIALIVNVLKAFNVVSDGNAPTFVTGLNILGLVALFLLNVFNPSADIAHLDAIASAIAQVGIAVLGLVTQILGSKVTHYAVKGSYLIGFSNSYNEEHNG